MKHSLELFEQPIPVLHPPVPQDGALVASLARTDRQEIVGELMGDLALFDDFRLNSIVAELNGELVGAVLAYVPPFDPETLFILQVVVAEGEEDKGLGSLMLGQVMRGEACAGVSRVQTTIRSDDEMVWSLFRRFARWQRSRMEIEPFITQALTPHRRHENDNLVTIRLQAEVGQAA